MTMPSGAKVLSVTAGWAMGEYANCIAIVWRQQPTVTAFRARAEALLDLSKRHPGRCALVEIVEPSSTPPLEDARKVAMEVFRQLGPSLCAIAFVLEGGPVRGALVRAIITGMLFLVKQPQPAKVCKRVNELADWVKPRIGSQDPEFAANLHEMFEHLRAQIGRS